MTASMSSTGEDHENIRKVKQLKGWQTMTIKQGLVKARTKNQLKLRLTVP
jgi:hypothetical protein